MNAEMIIEEITHLPLEEQSKVVAFVRHMPNEKTLVAMAEPLDDLPRFDSVEALMEDLNN